MTHPSDTVQIAPGVTMPVVGFGTWQIRGEKAYDSVRSALDAGYRHIDTATLYENESRIGQALADSGVDRSEVFVTTKINPRGFGRVRATLETSLTALRLDHVDLWLIHWPRSGDPVPDVWRQMRELRDAGLTRAIGVSNYDLGQIDALVRDSGETPAVNQIPWRPGTFEADVLAGHRDRGIVVEGYSGLRDTDLTHPALADAAAAHGVTPAQVALRWHLEHDIVVIPKSVHPDRIAANLALDFPLTPAEVTRIDAM
jgi:2,5-diketo-D-gluconate reductase A